MPRYRQRADDDRVEVFSKNLRLLTKLAPAMIKNAKLDYALIHYAKEDEGKNVFIHKDKSDPNIVHLSESYIADGVVKYAPLFAVIFLPSYRAAKVLHWRTDKTFSNPNDREFSDDFDWSSSPFLASETKREREANDAFKTWLERLVDAKGNTPNFFRKMSLSNPKLSEDKLYANLTT